MNMVKSNLGIDVQVFPLAKGKVNITTGTIVGITMFICVVDGSITITWGDNTTSTIACSAGDTYGIADSNSVTIVSGTFHLV